MLLVLYTKWNDHDKCISFRWFVAVVIPLRSVVAVEKCPLESEISVQNQDIRRGSRSISQVKFESLDLKDPKDTVLLECLSFVYMVEWLEWNAASVGPAAAAVGSHRNWTGRRCSGGRWSTADSRCSAFSGTDGRRKPATDQRRAVRLWGWWHVLWRMGRGKGPRARSVYGAEAPGGVLWRLELRIRGIGSLYLAKVSQFCGI